MDAAKRKALEAAGWKLGDAADFLEMRAEERQLLDTRVTSLWQFAGSAKPSN